MVEQLIILKSLQQTYLSIHFFYLFNNFDGVVVVVVVGG